MKRVVRELERQHMKDNLPEFSIGDTVDVHVRIVEGEKERTQIFNGTVIARKGSGMRETFTVRRIVQGEGVERTFPIHSPKDVTVEVKSRTSDEWGYPEDRIDRRKQRTLRRVADFYLERHGLLDAPCRFDVVALTRSSDGAGWDIELFQDAF